MIATGASPGIAVSAVVVGATKETATKTVNRDVFKGANKDLSTGFHSVLTQDHPGISVRRASRRQVRRDQNDGEQNPGRTQKHDWL
jgi:hypothetical protein